jgi:hypothetical protein
MVYHQHAVGCPRRGDAPSDRGSLRSSAFTVWRTTPYHEGETRVLAQGMSQVAMAPSNKRMQLTKAARCAPLAFSSWGQSLKAAFAADPRCCAGGGGREV